MYSLKDDIEQYGGDLYVKPFFNLPMSKHGLKQKEREYPIDMVYSKFRVYSSIVSIPEGFQTGTLPQNININDDLVQITYHVEVRDDDVVINGNYLLKKSVYSPADYTRLKDHLNTIVRKFNEQIVFNQI